MGEQEKKLRETLVETVLSLCRLENPSTRVILIISTDDVGCDVHTANLSGAAVPALLREVIDQVETTAPIVTKNLSTEVN